MKALSIQQPWAWAIVKRDKRVENRTWPTTYRGPVLIHASQACQDSSIEDVHPLNPCPIRGRLGLFDLDEQALAPETAAQLWMWFEWFV